MRVWSALILVMGLSARAAGPCFDFDKPVTTPFKASLALPANGADVGDSGKDKTVVWARLRGVVKKPLERLLTWLEDPKNYQDSEVAELTVTQLPPGPLLKRYQAHSVVKPFPLVKVEWTDEWAVTLVEGTPEKPVKVVLAYQKVEGTSHIARYCGTVVLTRVDDGTTDVAQSEESNITGKGLSDEVQGLADFLVTLRTKP